MSNSHAYFQATNVYKLPLHVSQLPIHAFKNFKIKQTAPIDMGKRSYASMHRGGGGGGRGSTYKERRIGWYDINGNVNIITKFIKTYCDDLSNEEKLSWPSTEW